MPNPNAIISKHVRLNLPRVESMADALRSEDGLSVELDGGRNVRLDPNNPRSRGFAEVLAGLEKLGRPAYVEVDPERGVVAELLIPHVGRVVRVDEAPDGAGIMLDLSHARHRLRRESPDFVLNLAAARDALDSGGAVILSENDAHDIIDIRPFERTGADRRLLPDGRILPRPAGAFQRLLWWIWHWPIWPWWWFWGYRCISAARAQQVFDSMAATTCNPLTVPPPCIPFLYPDDGCWGRAHEMCRLMIAMGLLPRKVWISGWLQTPTRNNPNCVVYWGWHVAPTLCVRRWRWWWWFWPRKMVIDPSLFTTPVTVATWKSVQGDPSATLTYTAASDFLWGSTDPTHAQTNAVLATYRLQLQNRSNGPSGPPPYAHCP